MIVGARTTTPVGLGHYLLAMLLFGGLGGLLLQYVLRYRGWLCVQFLLAVWLIVLWSGSIWLLAKWTGFNTVYAVVLFATLHLFLVVWAAGPQVFKANSLGFGTCALVVFVVAGVGLGIL